MKILEKYVAGQVRDYLRHRGWRAVRTQFAFAPGSFSTGEPGMPDYLFLRYLERGGALALWIELKSPHDKRRCNCAIGRECKQCRQRGWHERERSMGAVVWVVDDFDSFAAEYERAYGWLHSGERARGQLDLIGGL